MNIVGRLLGMGMLGVLLAGCIEQDVKIRLNADGSGTLAVTRYLSSMESGALMLGEDEVPSFTALTVVRRSIHDSAEKPARKVEESEYAFSNLAEALPELENLIPLMPRFTVQGDRLSVAVSHEMNEYHGFGSESDTNNFYNLEIEFPVPPESGAGVVEGNRVAWKADQDQLKAFQKSEIGTVLFECTVPSSAVRLDLTPRLVEYRKDVPRLGKKKEPKLVSSLNVTIPIVSKDTRWTREGSNATLGLYLPVDPDRLPLCYGDLTIKRLVIDGLEIVPELQSEPSGVFSGTGPQGQEAPGIPIKLQFGWNSHLLKSIDRIEVFMNAAVPAETSLHTLAVDAATATNAVLNFQGNSNERIAVLELNHVFWQTAKLKLATNLKPTDLSMVYLDTEYGLRYPAKGIAWQSGDGMGSNDRSLGEKLFGKDGPFSIVEIYFPHIPTTSFRLVFERVEELSMKEIVLSEENIHVN